MDSTVAFFGLGDIGLPMAKNLVRKGIKIYGVDILPARATEFAQFGGNVADGRSAVGEADIVISVLPSAAAARSVYIDDNISGGARPNTIFIDCSTIDLKTSSDLAGVIRASGHGFLDAPVSGGSHKAARGELTILVGGEFEVFNAALSTLSLIGSSVLHLGPAGSGLAAKICNNLMFGVSMLACAEACNLAQALGIDPKAFYDAVRKSSGQSWAMDEYCPVPGVVPSSPASRQFVPGGRADILLKDLAIALDLAEKHALSVPALSTTLDAYRKFCSLGNGAMDVSAIGLMLGGFRNRSSPA